MGTSSTSGSPGTWWLGHPHRNPVGESSPRIRQQAGEGGQSHTRHSNGLLAWLSGPPEPPGLCDRQHQQKH